MLLVGSATVMGHLYITPLVFSLAGRDSWLCIPVVLAPAALMAIVLARLASAVPGRPLVDILYILLGKTLGRAAALIYTGYFLLVVSITLRGLMDFMSMAFLQNTPPVVIGITFLLVSSYAVFGGLEKLARVNLLLLPLLIIMGITAFSLTFPFKEYSRLLPLIEQGILPVFRGSVPLLGLLGELVVVLAVLPALKKERLLWTKNLSAVIIISLMFIGPLTGPVAMFGREIAASLNYPTFTEIEYIQLGQFFNNFQVLAISLWLFGSFGRISLFFYATTHSASRLLGISDYKKLIPPAGLLIIFLSIFYFTDILAVKNFLTGPYSLTGIILGVLFPVILLALAPKKRC